MSKTPETTDISQAHADRRSLRQEIIGKVLSGQSTVEDGVKRLADNNLLPDPKFN